MAWVRVIGDSLSDATRQAGDWTRTNINTQSANIARANDAERYFTALNRNDEAEQFRRQQIADAQARDAERERRSRFEWGLARDDRAREVEAELGVRRQKLNFDKAQQQEQLRDVANTADFMSRDVSELGTAMESARERYERASKLYDTAISSLQSERPGLSFDNKTRQFVAKTAIGQKPEEIAAASQAANEANARIAQLTSEFNLAGDTYNEHLRAFNQLRQEIGKAGLNVSKRDGKYVVFNPYENRTHSWIPQAITGPPRPVPGAAAPSTFSATVGDVRAMEGEASGPALAPVRDIAPQFGNWNAPVALPPQPAPAPATNTAGPLPTATNRQTGQKLVFKDGAWQPLTSATNAPQPMIAPPVRNWERMPSEFDWVPQDPAPQPLPLPAPAAMPQEAVQVAPVPATNQWASPVQPLPQPVPAPPVIQAAPPAQIPNQPPAASASESIEQFADRIRQAVRNGALSEDQALSQIATLEAAILRAFKAGKMSETVAVRNLMKFGATRSEAIASLNDE